MGREYVIRSLDYQPEEQKAAEKPTTEKHKAESKENEKRRKSAKVDIKTEPVSGSVRPGAVTYDDGESISLEQGSAKDSVENEKLRERLAQAEGKVVALISALERTHTTCEGLLERLQKVTRGMRDVESRDGLDHKIRDEIKSLEDV